MNEYTERINKAITDIGWNPNDLNALELLREVLHEMSEDIQNLRSRSHSHEDDY